MSKFSNIWKLFESRHDKSNQWSGRPAIKDSDKPKRPPIQIRILSMSSMGSEWHSLSSGAQRRLCSGDVGVVRSAYIQFNRLIRKGVLCPSLVQLLKYK